MHSHVGGAHAPHRAPAARSARAAERQCVRTCRLIAGERADAPLTGAASRRTVLKGLMMPHCRSLRSAGTAAGMFCCSACGCGGGRPDSGTGVWPSRWGWYDRYFAAAMATTMQQYELAIAPLKRRLFAAAVAPGSRVLELGMGTGPNLRYYAGCPGVTVTGVDVNSEMAPYALEAAKAAGLPRDRLRLVTGDAQALPLGDASFDVVISTLVLCSVPDVATALREAARVLRPGGRFLYIEHVFASPQRPGLRLQQRLLDPLQQLAADGCHLTRDTGALLRSSGLFSKVDAEPEFEVPGQGLIAPHSAGIATF